jgi:hypothetical protein
MIVIHEGKRVGNSRLVMRDVSGHHDNRTPGKLGRAGKLDCLRIGSRTVRGVRRFCLPS